MEWDEDSIARLSAAVSKRLYDFSVDKKTDRRNLSELWNKHLLDLDIIVVRHPTNVKRRRGVTGPSLMLARIVDIINRNNHQVADAICIPNPDRFGQFILVPRELAAKILAIGMP